MEVIERECLKDLIHPEVDGKLLSKGKNYTTLKSLTDGKIHVMTKRWFWITSDYFQIKKLVTTCKCCNGTGLKQTGVIQMEWISVSERLPENDGNVLLHRITNESQKSMSISIFPANMVKNCEPSTHWQPLPPAPTVKPLTSK